MIPDEIKTERLHLRPFRFSDLDAVLRYADDAEWSRFLPVPTPYTELDAQQFLARTTLTNRNDHPSWAITLDGTAIGGINIQFSHDHRIAEIGYSLARAQWNRGYTTEAARAVVDTAFSRYVQLRRIRALADKRNIASIRVMEKIGMTLEGCLRSNRYIRDEFVDDVCYGLLRNEWIAG